MWIGADGYCYLGGGYGVVSPQSSEEISVLNKLASGHCVVGERSFTTNCICSCVPHVQVFVDYWSNCKAFQPHACMPRLLVQHTKANPLSLQSETFEYVHIDRKYRYVSEQVSYHPSISACWAESPSWLYYGEVRAPPPAFLLSTLTSFCLG